jgi:uncharacterized protein
MPLSLPILAAPNQVPEEFYWPAGAEPSAVPLRTFVVKIHSRCNLKCPYCYEFEGPDQSWRKQPLFMDDTTITRTAMRINEHAAQFGIEGVFIVLHGGEPFLVGHKRFHEQCRILRDTIRSAKLAVGVQTNGTLLDDNFINICEAHEVYVGVSSDGPPEFHDRTRVDGHGRGTSAVVERAIHRLSNHPSIFGGVLCVVNPECSPIRLMDYFSSLPIPSMNLLLPDNHYRCLPSGMASPLDASVYGDWLKVAFDRWYTTPSMPPVTMFDSLIRRLLGGTGLSDSFGNEAGGQCIVRTDGGIESLDVLKTCYSGAVTTPFNVFDHGFDAVMNEPNIKVLGGGKTTLCSTCRSCAVADACGGGYLPHRYSQNGFVNPSVYCSGLKDFIRHMAKRVWDDLRLSGQPVPPQLSAVLAG